MMNIHTPRDELICGAIDRAEEFTREGDSVSAMYELAKIRRHAERMEAKLISRRDEARAALSQPQQRPVEITALTAKEHIPCDLRLDAYYYSFCETGVPSIDRILSAVACAGKAYHSTDYWTESAAAYKGHEGDSPICWIQNAANDAAKAIAPPAPAQSVPLSDEKILEIARNGFDYGIKPQLSISFARAILATQEAK